MLSHALNAESHLRRRKTRPQRPRARPAYPYRPPSPANLRPIAPSDSEGFGGLGRNRHRCAISWGLGGGNARSNQTNEASASCRGKHRRSARFILHPVGLVLPPALSKSILLVASNSRQLTNSMSKFGSGVILSKYEFRSRHSASHTSRSVVAPLNNVRITWSHFTLLSQSMCVKVSFRSSSLSPNSEWLTLFCAVACDELTAHTKNSEQQACHCAVSVETSFRNRPC
jgi:hypothetical protein